MQKKDLGFKKGATKDQNFRVVFGNHRAQAAEMIIQPGDTEGNLENRHRGADQWLFVVSGHGKASVNGKMLRLAPGTLLLIEHGDKHEILNTGRTLLRTLNIYTPPAYSSGGDPLPRARK